MTGDESKSHRSCWDRKPVPDGFAETFVRFGWRGVETFYGARTAVNRRWIEEAGGPELIAQRQQYRANLRALRDACPA